VIAVLSVPFSGVMVLTILTPLQKMIGLPIAFLVMFVAVFTLVYSNIYLAKKLCERGVVSLEQRRKAV